MSDKKKTFWIKAETFTATARIDTNIFDDPYTEAGTQVLEFVYALKCIGRVNYWNFQNVSIRTTKCYCSKKDCGNYTLGSVFYISETKAGISKKYYIKHLAANAGLWSFIETINMMERLCEK